MTHVRKNIRKRKTGRKMKKDAKGKKGNLEIKLQIWKIAVLEDS